MKSKVGRRGVVAFLVLLLASGALIAPGTAKAADDTLVVRVVPPLVFTAPTASCPEGGATFDLQKGRKHGSGTACFLSITPVTPCSADVCQVTRSLVRLRLPGGRITIRLAQFETGTFDPGTGSFTLALRFKGTVTRAKGKFREFRGGHVSGGGTTVFAADGTVTPNLRFVIREDEEENDDDDDD